MTVTKRAQLVMCAILFTLSIGVNSYITRPRTVTVLSVIGAIILSIRFCAIAVPQVIKVRQQGGFLSLAALMVPVMSVWQIASYTDPPAPWLALLGSGLSDLGYTLAAALVVGHFDILALYNRLTTACAAVATFVIGTVLINIPSA